MPLNELVEMLKIINATIERGFENVCDCLSEEIEVEDDCEEDDDSEELEDVSNE